MPRREVRKMECVVCNKEIPLDENCYQIRYGYLTEDDEFLAEEDFGYAHEGCLPIVPTM
jgi:hypothetical protein